jgi:hypothetical protein
VAEHRPHRRPRTARGYIDTLLLAVVDGRVPGKVFDREIGLDAVPDGYGGQGRP